MACIPNIVCIKERDILTPGIFYTRVSRSARSSVIRLPYYTNKRVKLFCQLCRPVLAGVVNDKHL